ncbi:MAG: VCBS repeat-containing protein [Saprospiraceae bacterium]|nr:VCBS repeat-containing protein [Saprospiraceae bacterium]
MDSINKRLIPSSKYIFIVLLISGVSCQNQPEVREKLNNKIPSFQHEIIDGRYQDNPWAKIAADLDQDGKTDIIIGGQKGPLTWYRNPDWKGFVINEGGYQTVDGEAGDIDGDGDPDVVMGGLIWYENPGNLLEEPNSAWLAHQIIDHPTHDVELADIDQNGTLDIVTRNQSDFGTMKGNTIHIWYNEGEEPWREKILECEHGEGLRIYDLDGDMDIDIIGGGFWFENSENWPLHKIVEWHGSANVDIGDFNLDGKVDIVLTPSELSGQFYRISWFEQPMDLRNGQWVEHILVAKMECVVHGVATADFNHDGLMDIAYSEMHQGVDPDEVVVLINGEKGEAWNKIILSEKGSHSIQVALINADNTPDILGANWSGEHQPIEIWTTTQ